jgi:hypothetical protein
MTQKNKQKSLKNIKRSKKIGFSGGIDYRGGEEFHALESQTEGGRRFEDHQNFH